MPKLAYFILYILFPVIHASTLNPDIIKDHCLAFNGSWENNHCRNRLEFQQKPLAKGRIGINLTQWCEARGGDPQRNARGMIKCKRPQQRDQGIRRYPLESHSFEVTKKVVSSCLDNHRIENAICNVRATNDNDSWNYTNSTSHISTIATAALGGIVRSIGDITYRGNGDQERDFLVSTLKNYVASNNLNSCQKACLIKCASSNVLRYNRRIRTKLGGISHIYGEKEGECTEFSSIANHLGRELNIPVRTAGGFQGRSGHAYNYFEIEGIWYLGEPQSGRCHFYHTSYSLDKYQERHPHDLGISNGTRRNIEVFEKTTRRSRRESTTTTE